MYKHFSHIKDYLSQFSTKFSLVAISETWITQEKEEVFELEGYDFRCMNRIHKGGGGTALFIDKKLKHKVIDHMSAGIEDLCEFVTVEIEREKKKNILVSCVYRAPSSSRSSEKRWKSYLLT